ncbi:MAG: putative rane protein [Herbinix sp.]|jgi:hypothetical protein|nr:putative rane protein [Herbinix sp.]
MMEQIKTVIPLNGEEKQTEAMKELSSGKYSPLLHQVRQKYNFFTGISLLFGIGFTFFFYKAGMGFNVLAFTLLMIVLLSLIMNRLQIKSKKLTIVYYTAASLLGLSSMLTSSEILQFINLVGILVLLDLSILHQFYEDSGWDFTKHLKFMFGLVFSSIAAVGMPFVDSLNFLKHSRLVKTERTKNIILGILISIPLLLVVGALLSSADLMFGEMTSRIFKFLFSSDILSVIFMIIFGCIACYCIICGAARTVVNNENPIIRTKADSTIAITVMSIIGVVYTYFCSLQIIYLFANGLFILPEKFTFAEYARRGFFELVAVTIINIILILICTTVFRENKVLKGIITFITVGTYIMIASAAYRMLLYIGAYHLTFMRLFVLLFLVMDALVLAGIITYVYRKKFPLFVYSVITVTACYLAFSLSRPDYFIAEYLINEQKQLTVEDVAFLTRELSLDAAPAVLPLLSDGERLGQITYSGENSYDGYNAWESAETYTKDYYVKINSHRKNHSVRDYNRSLKMAEDVSKRYPLKNITKD